MTTQNLTQRQIVFENLPTNTHFGPFAKGNGGQAVPNNSWTTLVGDAYIDMDGFDHLSFQFALTAGAADSVTLTIHSDDGVAPTFEWNETLGSYESTTNSYNASYVAANATVRGHLHLDDCNGKLFQVKLVVVGGGPINSGKITYRKTKV
jgi:hypothetical protein